MRLAIDAQVLDFVRFLEDGAPPPFGRSSSVWYREGLYVENRPF